MVSVMLVLCSGPRCGAAAAARVGRLAGQRDVGLVPAGQPHRAARDLAAAPLRRRAALAR